MTAYYLRSILLLCVLIGYPQASMSVVDLHSFDTESQRMRYHSLIEELRCPKCQNQNLAGSDSQIASDLRRELHRLLIEGKTDREVKSFMVDRYGDFVLYKPRLQQSTLVLWLLPIALFVLGMVTLFMIVRRRRKDQQDQDGSADHSLSSQEQETLQTILKDKTGLDHSKK